MDDAPAPANINDPVFDEVRDHDGFHALRARLGRPVRMLAISTNGEPDVVLYPDSGKIGMAERRPDGSGLSVYFRAGDAVDYWDGEPDPR